MIVMSFASYTALDTAPLFETALFPRAILVGLYTMTCNRVSIVKSGAGGSFYKLALLTNKN